MLACLLLPENDTTQARVEAIFEQIYHAAAQLGISIVGGHTEITYDLHRPVLVGTLIGEVDRERLVIPSNVLPGDRLLLTKGVPIEGTALLAREFPQQLSGVLSLAELEEARQYLYRPGISVVRDAQIATRAGRVHAMHDPTEGGLAALWELSDASAKRLVIDPAAVLVPELSRRICAAFGLNPLATIASGALLIAAAADDAPAIHSALESQGIACSEIGWIVEVPPRRLAGGWPGFPPPCPRRYCPGLRAKRFKIRQIRGNALASVPHLTAQSHVQYHTNHADNQRAQERRDKAIYSKAHPKAFADQAGQVEQQGIDQQDRCPGPASG